MVSPFSLLWFCNKKVLNFVLESSANKSSWYDLFAELDPLQNPDQLDMKNEDENKDNGAC